MKPTELASAISYRAADARPSAVGDDRVNLLRAGWRQRWIILGSIAVGVVASVIYLHHATPMYSSVGRVYVQRTIPPLANDPLSPASESTNYLYTQCEIIKSTGVVGAVAKQPNIASLPTLAMSRDVTRDIQQHLKAEVDPRNDLIVISYDCSNSTDGSAVVNAIIQHYSSFTARTFHDTAAAAQRILENEKAARDRQLSELREKIQRLQQMNPERRTNAAVEKLNRLTDTLTAARLATIDATSAYEAAVQRSKMNLPALSSAADPQLREDLSRLEEYRVSYATKAGAGNPELQSVDAAITKLQDRIAAQDKAAANAAVIAAREWRDTVNAKQRQIEAEVTAQEKLASSVNGAEAEYALLDADLQRTQKIADSLDSRIKELSVAAEAPAKAVAILEAATPSSKPISPERSRVLAGGTLLGLLIGIVLAWARNVVTQYVGGEPDEIEADLGIPILGSIPQSTARDLATGGRAILLESNGAIAEGFRSIRTTIVFGVAGEFKTLLITSPSAGDGKTTAAANLAIALAQSGQRTLLIDADLRRPSINKVFPDSNEIGITDVISLREKLRHAIQPTDIESLSVLNAGSRASNPSEMLCGKCFAQVIAVVTGAYDKIVIDSPPLGLFSDGRVLAAKLDATVLVVRAGRTSRKDAQTAVTSLSSVGARMVGVILNAQARPRNRSYDSSYAFSAGNIDLKPGA